MHLNQFENKNTQIYKIVNDLKPFYMKNYYNLIKKYKYDNINFNSIVKSYNTFQYLIKILQISNELKISHRKALSIDLKKRNQNSYKNTNDHRSTFYKMLKKLIKIYNSYYDNRVEKIHVLSVFNTLVPNPPLANNFNFKYTKKQRTFIADLYYDKNKNPFSNLFTLNKTNITIHLRKKTIPSPFPDGTFDFLSLPTVCKIIKEDERNKIISYKENKRKHNVRKYLIGLGHIQFDIKIIGRTETHFNKPIYIFDAKDQESKILFSKILERQDKESMICTVLEMINFYYKIGINIKTVRTDNAMVFKQTNFVKTGELNEILTHMGIKHEFIPLGEPECNGVIESHHRIFDIEMLKHFQNCESMEKVIQSLKEWTHYFNYNRYHYYINWEKLKLSDQVEIPINVVNKIKRKLLN